VAAIQTVNFIGVLIHGLDFLNWWPLQRSRLLSLGGIPDSILSAHTSGLSIDIFIPGLDSILKTHWLTRTGLSLITVYLFLAILATFKRMLHTVSVQQPFDFKNIRRVQIIILLVLIEMVGLDYWRTESMKPLKQLIESMPQPIVGTDSSYQNADAYGYILLLLLFTLLSIFRRGLILYQEQRVIEERLFHKKKLEALGTLANGVGHDFNNILTSIVGYAEIAKSESEPEKVRFAIERLLDSANRAKGLTQQIRIIGGKGAHREHEEIVDLSKELDELLMSIEPTIPDTIAIKKVFDCKKQFAVKLDPTKLYQVLLNLTTNAIQAMENTGGKMTFLIDDESVEDCKGYCLSIEDTGCGMTKDVQVNIFEPYFTTRNHSGGTGLGLALSRSIIEGYGGRLLVESEKGRGSIFSVWLPAYSEKETR
jgi:signal transduction histidine kinase